MKRPGLVMRSLAPLSYWLAWFFFKWATNPRWGLVYGMHPAAPYCGRQIDYYERLLGIQGKKGVVRL